MGRLGRFWDGRKGAPCFLQQAVITQCSWHELVGSGVCISDSRGITQHLPDEVGAELTNTEFGVIQQDASTAARLRRMGLGLLTASAGLDALGAVLSSSVNGSRSDPGSAVVAAMPVHWDRFMAHVGSQSELFAEYQSPQPAVPAAAARSGAHSAACNAAYARFRCEQSPSWMKGLQANKKVSVAGGQGRATASAADTLEQVLAAVSAIIGPDVAPNASLMEVGLPLCAPLL